MSTEKITRQQFEITGWNRRSLLFRKLSKLLDRQRIRTIHFGMFQSHTLWYGPQL